MYSCSCKLEEENCDISLHKLSWGLFCLIIIFFYVVYTHRGCRRQEMRQELGLTAVSSIFK